MENIRHRPSPLQRVVFVPGRASAHGHDTLTKESLAASLARLLGVECIRAAPGDTLSSADAYVVPCETLLSAEAAALGIHSVHDLFGGVVPMPFVATKTITHALVAPDAQAPPGWAPAFAERTGAVVLEGFSAFNSRDARRACTRLLPGGAVRVKNPAGVGGAGQVVVCDLHEFDALLQRADFAEPWSDGIVLERNLCQPRTVSVGRVQVGEWLLSYHGEQRLTRSRLGEPVYGGSTLHLVRGDFDALLADSMPATLRLAVEQAIVYHRAAHDCFKPFMASRCNYDVAQGADETGHWRSGVLEQSWRIGGASGAELVALHAWRNRPALRWARASTHELHTDEAIAPPSAQVHFDGHDAQFGRMLKYALLEADGDD